MAVTLLSFMKFIQVFQFKRSQLVIEVIIKVGTGTLSRALWSLILHGNLLFYFLHRENLLASVNEDQKLLVLIGTAENRK